MTNKKEFYLKDDVYFEPLFNHWYVWPYLIPPVTSSRYVVKTHRRIMSSFINNYALHIMAVKEKGMAGAEFLDCTEEQLPMIEGLIKEMDERCRDVIEMSDAVTELEDLLRKHTSGESVDYLYPQVPKPLQGYVEIFMDMEHRASYRLIEPLLYKSKYYKPELQTVSFGSYSKLDDRPFVLSTPRLPDENHVQLALDFNHPVLKRIFMARETPISEEEFEQIIGHLDTKGGLSIRDLFTDQPSRYQHEPVKNGVKVTYTGHAGFLVETPDVSIMIDPVITSRGDKFASDVFSFSQLPTKIDYICLTHTHQDHVFLETLLQLRHKTEKLLVPKNNGGSLADPSLRLMLKQFGFDVIEFDDLDELNIPGGKITSVPFLGEHGDLDVRSKTAWHLSLLGRSFFFGADSSNPDNHLYQRLGELFPDVDVLAIGMECVGAPYTWLYGALHTKMVSKNIKDSRRLNGSDFKQAFPMVEAFGAKQVFIYALGIEPWYKYFMGVEYDDDSVQIVESNKMLNACQQAKIPCEALYGTRSMQFEAR